MSPKAPRRPLQPLKYRESDLYRHTGQLWRIHATGGEHPMRWDEARTYGPLGYRWEPHPATVGVHPGHGVLYAATEPTTCFGEVFQRNRMVDLFENDRHLSGWLPERELVLLNMTDTWAARQGATFALSAALKSTCRAWTRAIFEELVIDGPAGLPQIDGLWTISTVTGRSAVTLFDPPAADVHPPAPSLSRPLHHDDLVVIVQTALDDLGYGFAAQPSSGALDS